MSPSLIDSILSWSKIIIKVFTEAQTFQIGKNVSMLYKCSPVIIVEPGTPIKRKFTKMSPVVEADKLLHTNPFAHAIKV
jgi:hypothetical protein